MRHDENNIAVIVEENKNNNIIAYVHWSTFINKYILLVFFCFFPGDIVQNPMKKEREREKERKRKAFTMTTNK